MSESLFVQCPSCDEEIGLTGTELIEPAVADRLLGQFRCHVCGSNWEIRPTFKAITGDDNA